MSQATTLGDDDGLDSAIYFIGDDFIENHYMRNLGKRKKSLDEFQNVTKHIIWVQHLTNNMSNGGSYYHRTTGENPRLGKQHNNHWLCQPALLKSKVVHTEQARYKKDIKNNQSYKRDKEFNELLSWLITTITQLKNKVWWEIG